MQFIATEAGFEDGLGGASNSASNEDYHYILFGRQTDEQNPELHGVYFELDDQVHGAVDCVTRVDVTADLVRFELRNGREIVVRRGTTPSQWSGFLKGIQDTFEGEVVHEISSDARLEERPDQAP